MSKIGLFTPVAYAAPEDAFQRIHQEVDEYFYFFGKKAIVLPSFMGVGAVEVDAPVQSYLAIALKILAWVVLPLWVTGAMFAAKCAFRCCTDLPEASSQASAVASTLMNGILAMQNNMRAI